MANKWKTTLEETDAIKMGYTVDPNVPSSKKLTRGFPGIDRTVSETLATASNTRETRDNPLADNVQYNGTWRIGKAYIQPVNDGDLAGSDTVVEELASKLYDSATSTNEKVARVSSRRYEQNENAWMYYEWFDKYETKKWVNMSEDGAEDAYDLLRQIHTGTLAWLNAILWWPGSPSYPGDISPYSDEIYSNTIFKSEVTKSFGAGPGTAKVVEGTYYIIEYGETEPGYLGIYYRYLTVAEITDPHIEDCTYELEADGSYTLYRTLYSRSSQYFMRTRTLKYYGMVLTKGTPVEDDSKIWLDGFLNETEVIHENAKFRVGCDTYRVTADKTAANNEVLLDITPHITAATEELGNDVQVYWEAL